MLQRPTFSLIVPTLNRTTELRKLLISFQCQIFKNFEVIVVDQNKDDRIDAIINEFTKKLNLHRIRQNGTGVSRARNKGWLQALGRIITFPDDDCEYPIDVLEKVLKKFNDDPQLDGLTLPCKAKDSSGNIAWFAHYKQGIHKYNIFSTVIEATIFLKTTAIENIYFDQDMGVGAATPYWSDEGADLILRRINKGFRFVYFPDIIIHHPNPMKHYDKKAWVRSYKYGIGRGRYLRKHNYPWWFVLYVYGLYVVGIGIGCIQLNIGKIKFYGYGLKGRIEGYRYSL